ncbi:MAG: AraC family transcriptional regulator [Verrucomicrobia bacterium]|nr:AraC family transcriptional regulator [Verrucomicrobiota bacterium]
MTQNLRHEYHRPSKQPSFPLPMGVMSAGRYRFTRPFASGVRIIRFAQLFWGVAGLGTIVFNKDERILKPNQIALYLPGMLHKWYTRSKSWDFYWMALDGPLAAVILSSFGLNAGIYEAGPCPIGLFRKLIGTRLNPGRRGEIQASMTAFQIIFRAVLRGNRRRDPMTAMAVEQIHEYWPRHDFNIKSLAGNLQADRSTLSRRFHKALGIAPSDYLSHLRIQHSLLLLHNSNLPATEIMTRCGYKDACYFSRLIKHTTGQSPRQFRTG